MLTRIELYVSEGDLVFTLIEHGTMLLKRGQDCQPAVLGL